MPVQDPAREVSGPTASLARLFRNRNFTRLWVGSVTSAGGAAVGSLILVWMVYGATHSSVAISLLGIVQLLPTLLFGLLAGALIDRLDRRRLMIACDVGRAVSFGLLALVVLVYGISLPLIVVIVFAVATFSTVFRPATNAAIPRIVSPEDLADGNGLLQGGGTIAQFVGSPVGGVLLLALGAAAGLAVNALTFAISGVMIFLLVIPAVGRRPEEGHAPGRSLLRDVRDGLRFLRSQKALLVITLTAMVGNFFFAIWGSFMVIYAAVQLHEGAVGFSVLIAANTAGFAVGALLPGRLGSDRAPGLWLPATWGLVGFFILGLAATSSLAVAAALTLGGGLLLSVGNTVWLSGVQRTVPDAYLGRYFATDEAGSFAMTPAGIAVGGVLVLLVGISWTYLVAGVGALIVGLPLVLSRDVLNWGKRALPSAAVAP